MGLKHGLNDTPVYHSWQGMKQRCLNPRHSAYKNYGGRGITVCEQWMDFRVFLADVGPKPSPTHSIDRIDNDGNYEPSNVRWATIEQQSQNKRPRGPNAYKYKRTVVKTHCKHGHEYTEANTKIDRFGVRKCRACWREYAKGRYTKVLVRKRPALKTHCPQGHPYTWNAKLGYQRCLICRNDWMVKWRRARRFA